MQSCLPRVVLHLIVTGELEVKSIPNFVNGPRPGLPVYISSDVCAQRYLYVIRYTQQHCHKDAGTHWMLAIPKKNTEHYQRIRRCFSFSHAASGGMFKSRSRIQTSIIYIRENTQNSSSQLTKTSFAMILSDTTDRRQSLKSDSSS